MKCENCGEEVIENSKFCTNCGDKIKIKDETIISEDIDKSVITSKIKTTEKIKPKEKGKARKIIGTFLIIVGLISIPTQKNISGVWTSVFVVFFGASLLPILYEKYLYKTKIPKIHIILPIALVLLFGWIHSIGNTTYSPSKSDEEYKTDRLNSIKEKFTEYKWPTSKIAKLIPTPKSNIGEIEWEAYYGFVIYVGNTSLQDYVEYVDKCAEYGFTVNYRKGNDYYYANNKDGYHLSLNYEGDEIMFIRIDEPQKETNNNDTKADNDSNVSHNNNKNYSVGDTISCKSFDVKLEKFIIKKKGTSIDSYFQISDPEWIGVILTVKNTDSYTNTFYTSQAEIRNSNGEFINHSYLTYAIWGNYPQLNSPELAPGGTKTGYIQFTNNNQDNTNLALIIDCKDKFILGGPNYVFDLKAIN